MNLILCCLGRHQDVTDPQRVASIKPGRLAADTMLQQDVETTQVFPWIMLKLSVLMESRPEPYLAASPA